MTSYILGADRGADQKSMDTMKTLIEQKGHTVNFTSISPEQESAFTGSKEDIGIFVVNGVAAATIWSFKVAIEKGTIPPTIFAHAAWLRKDGAMASEQTMLDCPFTPEWDAGFASGKEGSMQQDGNGVKTVGEYAQKYSQYIHLCYADTPEEMVEKILNEQFSLAGTNTNTDNSNVGGAVKIPDVTFYGLIKQIMGATDSLFVIANNMAYLLSFKDIFKYRDKFNKHITKIKTSDVISDTMEKNWSTDGYYNSVEVEYSEGTIKYSHDALVKQYGENTFYYDCSGDDYETAKAKAQALLTAHVRDYSTDINLKIFYNPNITVGSWVKVDKTLTQIQGKTRKEAQQDKIKQKGKKVDTKRKGINITNITKEIVQKDNQRKAIYHITDEKGNKTDVEEEQSDYDLFFVQDYACKWDKNNSLIMNLHLKYGPDTPEDPINATISTGGGSNANGAAGGQYGDDNFTIFDICVANNKKILGHYSGGERVQEVKELVNSTYMPEPSHYKPRANPNSNYAKKYSQMKSPAEVYAAFRSEYKYSLYADNCSCWKNATDFYDNAGKTANCGDTTCLLKVFFDCIGVPSCGVHIDGHYFNAIQINGTWEIIDGVRLDNQTCGFPDGTGYCFGNPNPCSSYKSNGGDSN